MSGLSVKLPLAIDDTDGAYSLLKTYLDLVRQNFKMLLLTNPGERIMDINFGVGLHHELFEQNTPYELETIKGKIAAQVGVYMPYIELNDILIEEAFDGNGVHIQISYIILPLAVDDLLSFDLDENTP
jgi:phage baseplate assembly protein W